MVNYVRIYFSEGDTLGVRFFTAFCNHWHCTFAMVLSLLCNHWQFLLGFLQWLNKTKIQKNTKPRNQKAKKTKKTRKKHKKMTRPNSLPLLPPLGCAILFFLVCCFFVFWFLGFWFVVGFSAMAKQNQNPKKQETKRPKKQTTPKKLARPNSLPLLPPWGVQSRFLCFFCLFGFLVSCFLVFWFLVFWFVVGFLKGWQNNTKVKDLDLTLPVLPL